MEFFFEPGEEAAHARSTTRAVTFTESKRTSVGGMTSDGAPSSSSTASSTTASSTSVSFVPALFTPGSFAPCTTALSRSAPVLTTTGDSPSPR